MKGSTGLQTTQDLYGRLRAFAIMLVTEDENGIRIKIIFDPRAGMCPLARSNKEIDASFIKEIYKSTRYLIRDKKILEYLKAVSLELNEIIELKRLLGDI